MYQRLFAVKYNGKKFLLFRNVKDSHIAFLEWKEDGNLSYPDYLDYVKLNNIYNNHNYGIVESGRINFTEKVNWKDILLVLLMEGSFLLGASTLMPHLTERAAIVSSVPVNAITDREALSYYFEERITRDDVVEAINNNPNIDDKNKAVAIEVLDTNIQLDPDIDLRIYYENMKRLKIVIVPNGDTKYADMRNAGGWFNAEECTIYLRENFTGVIDHELNHAVHTLHLNKDGTAFMYYETQGHSLAEAMTEIITNKGNTSFSLAYNTPRRLLKYFLENTEEFNYHIYNTKGISALIEELKEKYPDVDIDYIISYIDKWTESNNKYIEELDLYNYKEFLDELFKIAIENIKEDNPYKAFDTFFEMANERLRKDYAKEYLKEYIAVLESKGLSNEDTNALLRETVEKETNYAAVADEEKEGFLEEKFQEALNSISKENAYKGLMDFIRIFRSTEYHTYELEAEYEQKYDQEVINRGILTQEQINQIRSITSFIKTDDNIYLACLEHDLSYGVRQEEYIQVFNYGREYQTEIINEQGEKVPFTISDPTFKLSRTWFDSNRMLNFIAEHQGTPLGDITNREAKEAIAEEFHFFDDYKYNKLSNGEVLFDEATPDMFVVVGKGEDGELGFQLERGEEILYSTVDRFATPTVKIPYSVYSHMVERHLGHNISEEEQAIDYLLSAKYFDDAFYPVLGYYAPNLKIEYNTEYDYRDNPDVNRHIYEFEEPIRVIIDGKEYTQADVYFYTDFDKGYEAIDENIMLHIPGEEDVLIGNYSKLEMKYSYFYNLEDILNEMGKPIPDNRELSFTKAELKELLREFLEMENERTQKK